MMIVVLFLMYYFPFITCIHCRENMILSENSIIYVFTSKMWQNNKHTHIHARLLVCFSFSTKKNEKQEKKKKRRCIDDVTACCSC